MSDNLTDELERLASLRDRGALSDREFEQQKARLLGGGAAVAAAPIASKSHVARNILLACVAIFILLVIISALAGAGGRQTAGTAGDNAAASTASAQPPLPVSAVDLAKAYEDNEAAAQKRYDGRPLLVGGIVTGVDLDITDDPIVLMRGSNQFLDVHADLVDADKPKASDLHKGQTITLLCQAVSEVLSDPMLSDCSFAS